MKTTDQIDAQATHDRVRTKYQSIPAFCRSLGVSSRTYYFAVKGDRGQTRRQSDAKGVLERLKAEGLLVECRG